MGSYPTFSEWGVRQISSRQHAYFTIKAKKAPAPSKLRKLNKDKRRYLVDTVVKILKRGEPTLFAFEASCRTGIRQALCLEGWGWGAADAAAADVVTLALRLIGAQRPTWKEGQPEWAQDGFAPLEFTRCQHCGGGIPEGRGSRNGVPVRYCSDLCGQAAYKQRARAFGESVTRAEYLAGLAALTRRTMEVEIPCENCRQPFRPGYKINQQRFCSRACADEGMPRPRRLADKPCVGCGDLFKPKLASQKYCSPDCYQGRGPARVRGVETTCPVCKAIFRYHSATQPKTHCSRKCAWVTRRAFKCEEIK